MVTAGRFMAAAVALVLGACGSSAAGAPATSAGAPAVSPPPAASSTNASAAAGGGSAAPTAASSSGQAGALPRAVAASSSGGAGAASSAGSTASAGSVASAGSSGAAASGVGGAAGEASAIGAQPAGASGAATLPAVTDLEKAGPFTPKMGAGPSGYVLYYPQELGKDGVKHPIVSWGPGAAENAASFSLLLAHLASHGFAVISYDATPQGEELTKGIDWMVAENDRMDGMFYQKLDASKITAGGHSAGSLATFVVAADKRLVTTLHISGGTFDPHTDIMNLHAPALFVCGEPDGDGLLMGDVARPNCDLDFMNAKVPVWYGVTKGAAHMTPTDIGDATIRAHQFGAIVGWLRWQLAGDTNAKTLFSGEGCTLCKDANWSSVQQKDL